MKGPILYAIYLVVTLIAIVTMVEIVIGLVDTVSILSGTK